MTLQNGGAGAAKMIKRGSCHRSQSKRLLRRERSAGIFLRNKAKGELGTSGDLAGKKPIVDSTAAVPGLLGCLLPFWNPHPLSNNSYFHSL